MTGKIVHLEPQKANTASLNLPSGEYIGASIEEELNYWLSRVNELPPHAQASYAEQIRSCAHHALFELTEMQIWKQSPEAMKRYAQTAVRQLSENALQLIEAQQSQQQKKVGLERKFREMDVNIQSCGKDIDFTGFSPSSSKLEPTPMKGFIQQWSKTDKQSLPQPDVKGFIQQWSKTDKQSLPQPDVKGFIQQWGASKPNTLPKSDDKIKNSENDNNFEGFKLDPVKPFSAKDHLASDPFWADKWTNNQERMALARMVGFVTEKVGEGIQMACAEKPSLGPIPNIPDPICLSLKGAAVVFHELGKLPVIRDVIKEAHSPNIPLQNALYEEFGIPKEQSQQYSEDAFTKVAPLVLLPTATGAGLKGVVSLSRGLNTANKTTQSFFKLRGILTPPETRLPLMQKAFGEIYNAINRHPKINVLTAITKLNDYFNEAIPLIELTEYTDELLWISAIKANPVERMLGNTKRYSHSSHNVSKITYGKESFIVKESFFLPEDTINEFVGANFLNSLELRYLKVPQPLGIGKTTSNDFFVVKSFIHGETFEEMLKKAGRSARNAEKQDLVLKDLSQANIQAGKAFGELQNKTLNMSSVISPVELATEYINKFARHMTDLESGLQNVGRRLSLNKMPEYYRMLDEFKRNPGALAYGFTDINPGSFTWSKADPSSIGFIDTEFVPGTFNSLKQPMVLANWEFSEFQEMLQAQGEHFGLSPNHISQLQNAFRTGYYSEFAGKRSLAAERFFDLNADLEVILVDLKIYNDLDGIVNIQALTASEKSVLDKLDLSIQKLEQKIANYYDK